MTAHLDQRRIAAPAAVVSRVIASPLDLPSWNPLFARLDGHPEPRVDRPYRLMLRFGLSGTFAYTVLDDGIVGMTWEVPGLHEECTWTIRPEGDRSSIVTHSLSRSGRLATILSNATEGLAGLRLERLASVIRDRSIGDPAQATEKP